MTLEEAEQQSRQDPKPIFVMVHANWCPHCKNFDKTTYQDPKVIEDLNTKFYPVKLNAHTKEAISYKQVTYENPDYDESKSSDELNAYHSILYELGAQSIPSIVFIDKDLGVRGTEMGYKPAEELRSLMGMYGN